MPNTTQIARVVAPVEHSFGYYMLIAVAMICVIVLIYILLYWDNKAKQGQPDRKPDPLVKAFFMTLAVAVILLLANFFIEDTFKKGWWTLPVIFVLTFGFYMLMLKKRLPLSFEEQYDIASESLKNTFNAREPKGNFNKYNLDAYTTSQEFNRPNLGNLLLPRRVANLSEIFYYQIDKITGEITKIIPKPSPTLKDRMMEKRLSPKGNVIEEEFSGEEKTKEEAAEVREEAKS